MDPLHALVPKARRRFAKTDPVLARILRDHPLPQRSIVPEGAFEALVSSIAHQQVSIAAGRTIYGRVAEASGGAVTPAGILAAGPDGLRAAGLSRPKASYVLDLAQRARSGELDFARMASAGDEEIVEALTAVKGIGAWTAKMFLIFHLSRPDVLAHEDLGLQVAVAKAYRVPRAKAAAKMQRLAPAWSPYASVAALSLWNWRRVEMAREAALKERQKPSKIGMPRRR
ncbi:MAG TPA: DNA-3-methyladenine glycosylase 2 family protein [Candidatus Thermoplasmatota archaeon]|nr:DNA-3-methyladenine glycosylase 2 family protein [Candidatus Thermoplasmatota archaeon]